MTSSSTFFKKRLENEVDDMERNSERFVPFDWYYLLDFEVPKGLSSSNIKKFAKTLLGDTENRACVVYVSPSKSKVYAAYSSKFEGSHFLEGSHQRLVSRYTYVLSKTLIASELEPSSEDGLCKLIELETREAILAFFVHKLSIFTREVMTKKLGLVRNELTSSELKIELSKIGIEWNDLGEKTKYGTFYKLTKSGDVSSTSKNIDFTDDSHETLFD